MLDFDLAEQPQIDLKVVENELANSLKFQLLIYDRGITNQMQKRFAEVK